MGGEHAEVGRIHGGDDRSTRKVGHGNHECVHRELRAHADTAEQLARAYSHPRVDRVNHHALAP